MLSKNYFKKGSLREGAYLAEGVRGGVVLWWEELKPLAILGGVAAAFLLLSSSSLCEADCSAICLSLSGSSSSDWRFIFLICFILNYF